jgi:hypothetical protein
MNNNAAVDEDDGEAGGRHASLNNDQELLLY